MPVHIEDAVLGSLLHALMRIARALCPIHVYTNVAQACESVDHLTLRACAPVWFETMQYPCTSRTSRFVRSLLHALMRIARALYRRCVCVIAAERHRST